MGRNRSSSGKKDDDGRSKSPRKRKPLLDEQQVSDVAARLPPLKRSASEATPPSVPTDLNRSRSDASPARRSSERKLKERGKRSPTSASVPSLSDAVELMKASSPSMKKRSKTHGKSASKVSSNSELKRVRSGGSSPRRALRRRSDSTSKKQAGSTPRKGSLGSSIEGASEEKPSMPEKTVSKVQLVTDAVSKMEVAVGLEAENEDEREAMIALQPLVHKLRRNKPGLRASFRRQDSVGQEYLLNLQPRSLNKSKLSPATPAVASRSLSGEAMDDMKALKVERKRMRVVGEMMSTETTYFEALQTVITLFIAPLKKSMSTDKPLLSEADFDLAFQNIEAIRVVNGELLKHMSKRKQNPEAMIWCDLLVTWLSNPDVTSAYQTYINGYEHARKFLSGVVKSSEEFASLTPKERDRLVKEGACGKDGKYQHARLGDFIKSRLSHALCGGFGSITSFLITPVQRLPRYLLFLRELDQLTPAAHPDRPHVEEAYELLKQMTGKIDERKNVYDAIYHKEALLMSFPPSDQQLLQDITDADRHLLAEGPLVEGDNVEYVLIFVDLIVCAMKSADGGLRLLWRASTYTDQIEVRTSEDGEYLYVVEMARFAEYPFFFKTHHVLYPFAEGMFSIDFWSPHFSTLIDGKKNQSHCATLAANLADRLAPVLMPKDAWDDLSIGMKTRGVPAGKSVLRQGDQADSLVLLQEGEVELSFCLEAVLAGGGADIVEMMGKVGGFHVLAEEHLLERRPGKLAISGRAVDFAKVTEVSLKTLHQKLAADPSTAARFFHLLALITGTRYLRVLSDEARPYAALLPVLTGSAAADAEVKSGMLAKLTSIPRADTCVHGWFPCYLNSKKKKKSVVELMVTGQHLCVVSEKKCHHQAKGLSVTINSSSPALKVVSLHIPKTRGLVELHFADYSTFASALRALEALTMRCAIPPAESPGPRTKVDLSDEDWDILIENSTEQEYKKGDVILSAGSFSEHVYQVLEGQCTATFQTCQGEERARVRVGELFGEVSFLLGIASTASVVAYSTVVVRAIPHADLATALHRHGHLAGGFFKLLACVTKRRMEKVHTTRIRSQALGSSTSESDSLK